VVFEEVVGVVLEFPDFVIFLFELKLELLP
jgi:hypothetical protein